MNVESKQQEEKMIETQVSKSGVFTLVKDENGVRIIIQNQVVSDKLFINYEAAEKYIKTKPYELILIASYIYSDTIKRMQEQQADYEKRNGNNAENNNSNN